MKLVKDAAHFNQIVRDFKARDTIRHTNCYLMPSKVSGYAQASRMSWYQENEVLVFLCEEDDFYYFYYFLGPGFSADVEHNLPSLTKPLISELIYTLNGDNSEILALMAYWASYGFDPYRTNRRMILVVDKTRGSNIMKPKIPGYKLAFADPAHLNEIYKMWKDYLDIYTAPIPGPPKIADLISKSEIITAVSESGILAAALQIGLSGNRSCVERIAVDKRHRRKGLAQALLDFNFSLDLGISLYYLWVNQDNTPAINLYKKNGYSFDSRASTQLIFQK